MKSCALYLPLFLAGLLVASPGHAQINTYEEMKTELKAKGQSNKTVSVDFTTDISLDKSIQEVTMTANGHIYGKGSTLFMNMSMDIPGMSEVTGISEAWTMRMTINPDGIMWIESSENSTTQVIKIDMENVDTFVNEFGMDIPFNSSMRDFLKQLTNPAPYLESSDPFLEFTLEGLEEMETGSVYVLNATLKDEGFKLFDPTDILNSMGAASFDSYKLYIGKEDGYIYKIDIESEGMQITQIFRNFQLNKDMPDEMFNYTPPAGAQVVDMTEEMEAQIESMSSGVGENGKYHGGDKNLPDVLGVDLDGKEVRLSDYRGKVVLIDFWATWCPPCIVELPDLLDTYAEFKDAGLVIIGVSLDNEVADLTAFQAEHPDMSWVQVCEEKGWDSVIVDTYGVQAIPHTLLVNQNGIVAGADLKGKFLRDKVNELLNW